MHKTHCPLVANKYEKVYLGPGSTVIWIIEHSLFELQKCAACFNIQKCAACFNKQKLWVKHSTRKHINQFQTIQHKKA